MGHQSSCEGSFFRPKFCAQTGLTFLRSSCFCKHSSNILELLNNPDYCKVELNTGNITYEKSINRCENYNNFARTKTISQWICLVNISVKMYVHYCIHIIMKVGRSSRGRQKAKIIEYMYIDETIVFIICLFFLHVHIYSHLQYS